MIRLLVVLPSFHYGGTNSSTVNMLNILGKGKYVFDILAISHCGPLKSFYQEYFILRKRLCLSILLSSKLNEVKFYEYVLSMLYRSLRRIISYIGYNIDNIVFKYFVDYAIYSKYDVIIASQEGIATHFVSYFKNTNRIAWVRSNYAYYLRSRSFGFTDDAVFYRSYNSIICVSEFTRKEFCIIHPVFQDKVFAIHDLQDESLIEMKSSEPFNEYSDYENDFLIVSLGRIDPVKKFSAIPKIAFEIKQKKLKFKWFIIGDVHDINEHKALINNIDFYGVKDLVILLGAKINPYPFIRHAHLLVMTSLSEACPRVLIEAKILKTPVVTTNYGSASEFIVNEVDGYIVPITHMHLVICDLIENESLYAQLKSRCSEYIHDNSKPKAIIEGLIS